MPSAEATIKIFYTQSACGPIFCFQLAPLSSVESQQFLLPSGRLLNQPDLCGAELANPEFDVIEKMQQLESTHWYAAHIRSRHEKKVAKQLSERHIDHFLPLYTTARRWSDRVAQVELPLFPGYLFVHIPPVKRLKVLEVPGVVSLVSSRGEPVPLPDPEIERLRLGLLAKVNAEPHPYLKVGTRARIINGAMRGLEGILVKQKDAVRVVISVELIMRSIIVDISMADIEPI